MTEKHEASRFGGKLHHDPPLWVDTWGEIFHVRIRCAPENSRPLTDAEIGRPLLESVEAYTAQRLWWATIFLLMPDHLHALVAFDPDRGISRTIGDWKRFHSRSLGISCQENFFDHRIRNHESLDEKIAYIRNNPVAKGLCSFSDDWKWVTRSEDPEPGPE